MDDYKCPLCRSKAAYTTAPYGVTIFCGNERCDMPAAYGASFSAANADWAKKVKQVKRMRDIYVTR